MCALYKRGKVWWYAFQFQGRRIQESTGMTNKTVAQEAEAIRRAALVERRAGIVKKPLPPKFEDYVPEFLNWSTQHHRDKTYKLHRTNCYLLLRYFTGKYLDEITSGMVEDFKMARIRETRSNARDGRAITPVTVNRALTTLQLIFKRAAGGNMAVSNPTKGVDRFEENKDGWRTINFEEEGAYLREASQPLRDIAQVILDTGMRPDEVFRIQISKVDFERRTIFNPYGKTAEAKRTVGMTDRVWEILKTRAIGAKGPYTFPSLNDPDKPIGSVRKAHESALVRARSQEHFRLYDLRHTFASRAAMAGIDLPTLAALLGHTSIQMTMRYVHPAEEHKREAVGKLEQFRLAEMLKIAERVRGVLQYSLQ